MSKRWSRAAAKMSADLDRQIAGKPLTPRNIRRLVKRLSPETAEANKDLIAAALAKARGEPR